MKLLFVGTNPGGGGTESHFVTLARALADNGHTVEAVVHPQGIIRAGLLDGPVRLRDGVFRNALDPRGAGAVRRAVRAFRPDWLVGSFSKEYWPLAVLARAAGVRLALFKHMDKPMRPLTHRFIPRLADRFIVISDYMRARFIERGVPSERLYVLHNPLDLAHFRPDSALRARTRAALDIRPDEILLGFVGALHPGKGIFVLADALDQAMAADPRLKALWVGRGEAADDFARRLRASPHAARHLQRPWADDVRPCYAAMDMLALPSTEPDTFGRVAIEAQACGVPVLGSRLAGIPETLDEGVSGLLIPPGDVPAWRDAVAALAADPDARARLRAAGPRHVAAHFEASVIAARFARLLEGVERP